MKKKPGVLVVLFAVTTYSAVGSEFRLATDGASPNAKFASRKKLDDGMTNLSNRRQKQIEQQLYKALEDLLSNEQLMEEWIPQSVFTRFTEHQYITKNITQVLLDILETDENIQRRRIVLAILHRLSTENFVQTDAGFEFPYTGIIEFCLALLTDPNHDDIVNDILQKFLADLKAGNASNTILYRGQWLHRVVGRGFIWYNPRSATLRKIVKELKNSIDSMTVNLATEIEAEMRIGRAKNRQDREP